MPAICWVCDSANVVLWKPRSVVRTLHSHDPGATDGCAPLTLWRCRACSFIFADADELAETAPSPDCPGDDGTAAPLDGQRRQMRWALRKALAAHPRAQSVLDVGAAPGPVVAEAERLGLDAMSVEHGTFQHSALAGRTFDVVLLVDVIQHVPTPVELLRAACRALAPGGIVLLVTPDVGSYFARRLRGRWWHFRTAHVGYFNRATLARAVGRAGLRIAREGRGVWYFRVGYLARRLTALVPALGGVRRFARHVPAVARLGRLVVRVNLRDSILAVLRRADDLEPNAVPREPGHDPALL